MPILSASEEWYWKAYEELCFDRPPSFGGVPFIPNSAMILWANHVGLSDVERDLLMRIVRSIDIVICQAANKADANK